MLLKNLCDITSSKRIFANEYTSSGIPFYRSKEIIELSNNKSISTELFITENKYNEIKERFSVPSIGDILMTAVGTLGITYLINNNDKFYFKDGNLIWIRDINENLCLSKYLYYYFQNDNFKENIYSQSIGSTQKAITIESLKKLDIPLPSIKTQHHIVNTICLFSEFQ